MVSENVPASRTKAHACWRIRRILDADAGHFCRQDVRCDLISGYLEVLPVNFALKSPIERQNIIYCYASYLKIAPNNLQILAVTQKADIEGYIARMRAFYENEPVESCREMIEDNINEVTYLAANEAVTRRFFLVFQFEARMKARGDGLHAIAERLREEEQTARRYLGVCGLEVLAPDYADFTSRDFVVVDGVYHQPGRFGEADAPKRASRPDLIDRAATSL